MKSEEILNLKYSRKEISKKTEQIYDLTLAKSKYITKPNFDVISTDENTRA